MWMLWIIFLVEFYIIIEFFYRKKKQNILSYLIKHDRMLFSVKFVVSLIPKISQNKKTLKIYIWKVFTEYMKSIMYNEIIQNVLFLFTLEKFDYNMNLQHDNNSKHSSILRYLFFKRFKYKLGKIILINLKSIYKNLYFNWKIKGQSASFVSGFESQWDGLVIYERPNTKRRLQIDRSLNKFQKNYERILYNSFVSKREETKLEKTFYLIEWQHHWRKCYLPTATLFTKRKCACTICELIQEYTRLSLRENTS